MHRLVLCAPLAILIAVACGSLHAAELASAESNVEERQIGGQVVQSERDEQEALYNYYFNDQGFSYETRLEHLKKEASVPSWRVPYSAAIHPESSGGLSSVGRGGVRPVGLFAGRASQVDRRAARGSSALSAYDRAFNGGEDLANAYEVRRIMGTDRALFPLLRMRRNSESWEGYCSGFTASTIKHPEPVNPVDAGDVGGTPGVVLQPSEIKALLTAIYNRTSDDSFLFLAPPSGRDGGPNMGTFHLALANYVGQAGCPIGIDRTKGRTSWNNPIYAYKVASIGDAVTKGGVQYRDVVTTVTYSFYGLDSTRQTNRETGARVGNRTQSMTFRYTLALDDEGRIIGGRSRNDSGHFLWIPLYPVQGTADGSVPGNLHLDVGRVIALARASAIPKVQKLYDGVTIGSAIDPKLEDESN
ncbi:MAG: hypothetical protein QGG71_02490 [Pirellulaceae bacterium]|jgi:hypothetical protein|nr:hypothetical protein [Pirellulaceae bacterium]